MKIMQSNCISKDFNYDFKNNSYYCINSKDLEGLENCKMIQDSHDILMHARISFNK